MANTDFINREEIHHFTQALSDHQAGQISEDDFTAQRLQNGIYGQRQDGTYMVRIKVPGGELNLEQLACVNELIKSQSEIDFASVTTRQDIQLHFVSLENVPRVMLRLADVGLTTREACGNTVRNVTACPSAGNCEKELVDVRPILNETVSHFLRHPLSQHLPRKFKMSFSGCESDCAYGMIHDLGVVATKKDEQLGFKVLVGGGLGHKPREAIELESFVTPDKLLAVIESVVSLHNKFSDRTKRARSRLKFLVDKFGEEALKEKYREIYKTTETRIRSSRKLAKSSSWEKVKFSKFSADRVAITLRLLLGDLKEKQLDQLIEIANKFSVNQLKTTQNQNLILADVPASQQAKILTELSDAGFDVEESKESVVACPGSWTCRLGITGSRDLAQRVANRSENMKIHISGCHNGCAQPQVSDIGLHGEGRRKFGRLIPYYRMYFGGNAHGGGSLALKGPEIPSVRVEAAIDIIQKAFEADNPESETFYHWANRKGVSYFSQILSDLTEVNAEDLPILLKDIGKEDEFKVLQLGGGECAGISEETVAAQMKEAEHEKGYRDIFINQAKYDSAIECIENMLRLVGKSVLFKNGELVGEQLTEILDRIVHVYQDKPKIVQSFESFLNRTETLRIESSKESFQAFSLELDEWIEKMKNESSDLYSASEKVEEAGSLVDLTDETCPMHYIKARKALTGVEEGTQLRFKLNSGEDTRVVSKSLESTGFLIVDKSENLENNTTTIQVLKPLVTENVKPQGSSHQVA